MSNARNLARVIADTLGAISADNLANAVAFPAGTLMLFQQTAAPTGWTKQTTHDNKALRVVSGTAGSGGTSAFTTVFANQTPTIGATTLSTAQMPSHSHDFLRTNSTGAGSNSVAIFAPSAFSPPSQYSGPIYSAGGGGSHTHSAAAITLNVQYVDLIIASKN